MGRRAPTGGATKGASPLRAPAVAAATVLLLAACSMIDAAPTEVTYPWHTRIVSTTFWVGEIFDPAAADGSQVISTYDSLWLQHYGGCDGVVGEGVCTTEARSEADGWFPTSMSPLENPFYLDVPFDDVNDEEGFASRGDVVPWAHEPAYRDSVTSPDVSLMKNRWVELRRDGHTCFGQVEDAGPGEYHDSGYVFGTTDARPQNTRYGGAGMDVSPALTGCLDFPELDGDTALLDWRFVDEASVPEGPWLRVVTTSGVQ